MQRKYKCIRDLAVAFASFQSDKSPQRFLLNKLMVAILLQLETSGREQPDGAVCSCTYLFSAWGFAAIGP